MLQVELFMGELRWVVDQVLPKNYTRGLKYSKVRCGQIFLSLPAHF